MCFFYLFSFYNAGSIHPDKHAGCLDFDSMMQNGILQVVQNKVRSKNKRL